MKISSKVASKATQHLPENKCKAAVIHTFVDFLVVLGQSEKLDDLVKLAQQEFTATCADPADEVKLGSEVKVELDASTIKAKSDAVSPILAPNYPSVVNNGSTEASALVLKADELKEEDKLNDTDSDEE